jgi:hypothetical protein
MMGTQFGSAAYMTRTQNRAKSAYRQSAAQLMRFS